MIMQKNYISNKWPIWSFRKSRAKIQVVNKKMLRKRLLFPHVSSGHLLQRTLVLKVIRSDFRLLLSLFPSNPLSEMPPLPELKPPHALFERAEETF